MIKISLCMIVKNEEKTIGRCLGSAGDIFDEIIIVDTGSTDRTKQEAGKFTEKIYDFAWIDDFSAARNFSFSKATMDYIFWMDADDMILPEDLIKFKILKNTLPEDVDTVMMKYNTGFDNAGNVTFSYYRERLVKRSRGFRWHEPVHEYLEKGGKIINSDICITHAKERHESSTRNLDIYRRLLAEGETLSSRGTYYYARELKDHGFYAEAAEEFGSFLDSGLGWVEDNISACSELARCRLFLKEDEKALMAMFRSFLYDTPRAELCCQIGYYFKEREKFREAVFWFGTAQGLKKPESSWGFIKDDCWGYIPSIECAVCYDRLGDYEKAEAYNEKAAGFNPKSPAVLYNKKYFEGRKSNKPES